MKENLVLPFMQLPPDLCQFLRLDIFDFSPLHKIEKFLENNPKTCDFLRAHFLLQTKEDFYKSLKADGYKKFTSKWISLYLNYYAYDEKKFIVNTELVEDMEILESKFFLLKRSSSLRDYLLLFYLNMISTQSQDHFAGNNSLDVYEKVMDLISSHSRIKIKYFDWMILVLINVYCYMGEKQVLKILRERQLNLKAFTMRLSEESKKQLYKNLYCYAYSVSDMKIFYENLDF